MLRPTVLCLTFVTGFTGLAYEVTWQKYLAILLGAHSEATAAVLGLFLGGLSLGYWLFGDLTRRLVERSKRQGRPAPLLVVYGMVEAGIGLYCVLFPWIFPLARSASVLLPTGAGALSFAVDVLLAATLILPPAVLMGGTIPILTQALARNLEDATRLHALVYAFNTAGAFLGALASGFVLVHWLGLAGVMYAMGAVNLVIGSVFVVLGGRHRAEAALATQQGAAVEPSGAFFVYGAAALLVGFAMMAFQTTVIRVAGLSFGSSEYTFSMVVAVFVLCIALGSFVVSVLPKVARVLLPIVLWGLAGLLVGLYFLLESGPYWAHVLRSLFRDQDATFVPYYVAVFGGILAMIGPAVLLSGAVLPLLFHALKHEVDDLGSRAGHLYSVNTVGSLLGALLGGYALLFWVDLHVVHRLGIASLALAACLVTQRQLRTIHFGWVAAALVVFVLVVGSFAAWRPGYLMAGLFRVRLPKPWTYEGPSALPSRDQVYSFYTDDPVASVAVHEVTRRGKRTLSILVNGKSDGNSHGDYPTMALAALIPALFAEKAQDAFVIGYGTGVTAGELAVLDEAESVTVAEISSGVVEAAPLFDFANHGASKHPKIEIVRSDAYRALLHGQGRYDVIVSEPSNPWVTGVEMLFSKEFLSEARDRLKPGGVYCQWYHLYETNDEAIELVFATYASVFDHVAVWAVNELDILLLGFRDDDHTLDLERLASRLERPDFAAGLGRLKIEGLPELLAHEVVPVGVTRSADFDVPIHSLYHPRLSSEAGRGFLVGKTGKLPFLGYGGPARTGAETSLLGRYLEGFGGDVSAEVRRRATTRACRSRLPSCAALVADWWMDDPDDPDLQGILRA